MSLERLQDDINWIKSKPTIVQLNIADANFGIFKERDLEAAKIIKQAMDIGYINEVQVSYTKKFNKELSCTKSSEPYGKCTWCGKINDKIYFNL